MGLDMTNLLLGQVIREVSNHDLGLGGDTIGRGASLPALTGTALALTGLAVLVTSVLVGNVLQGLKLGRGVRTLSRGDTLLVLLLILHFR